MSQTDRPETWQAAFDLIRTRGYEHRAEPFKLASGQLSHDYIDGKFAVDTGERLAIVCRAVADLASRLPSNATVNVFPQGAMTILG